MPWRAEYGQRNGVFGGWISKPGIDVTLAQPGEFLLDTASQVYQTVAKGDQYFVSNPANGAATYSRTVSLDSLFAPYSNLFMWADAYAFDNNTGTIYTTDFIVEANLDVRFNVVSGVVYLECITGDLFLASPSVDLRASWSVFRAAF